MNFHEKGAARRADCVFLSLFYGGLGRSATPHHRAGWEWSRYCWLPELISRPAEPGNSPWPVFFLALSRGAQPSATHPGKIVNPGKPCSHIRREGSLAKNVSMTKTAPQACRIYAPPSGDFLRRAKSPAQAARLGYNSVGSRHQPIKDFQWKCLSISMALSWR